MVDLAEVNADWLAHTVPKTRNTRDLIAHLRAGGPVTPSLAKVLADLLEGKLKAKPRPYVFADVSIHYVRAMLSSYKEMLSEQGTEAAEERWPHIEARLREYGIDAEQFVESGPSKGHLSRAARVLTAHHFGVSLSQLDERLSPRKARQKNR